jgi:putative ABC transport system permease protein
MEVMMTGIFRDLSFAFRSFLKKPGFILLAILALSAGIGINTAIFSVVHAVLIQPLPYKNPDKILLLWESSPQMETSVSYPNFLDWKAQNKVFESMAAFRRDSFNLSGVSEPERLQGRMISAEFLHVLGVSPQLGRDFRAEEDKPGGIPVVMLSHALWMRRFESNRSIVGKQILLNERSFTVVGITPADFEFGSGADLFVPIGQFSTKNWQRDNHPGIYVIGRMKSGITIEQVKAQLGTIAKALEKQYPDTNNGRGILMSSLREDTVGDIRPSLLLIMAAVGLVLFIACANVANMMLARTIERRREMAIRAALGASRLSLIRQVLIESLLLSFIAAVFGILFAYWGIDLLLTMRPDSLPHLNEIKINPSVLLFTLGISVVTGLLFGSIPAWKASATDVNDTLKEGGHHSGNLTQKRIRQGLIISEFALSMLLVLGSGLLIKSFIATQSSSPGFNSNNLLTMQISLSNEKYKGMKAMAFLETLEEKMRALPGVKSAAFTFGLPILGASESNFYVAGRTPPVKGMEPLGVMYVTSDDYFQTMGIPVLQGRVFDRRDNLKSLPVTIIDSELAKQFFPNQDPIGQKLIFSPDFPPFEIIGVVGHVKHYGLDTAGPVRLQYYMSFNQVPEQYMNLVSGQVTLLLRADRNPTNLIGFVRNAVLSMDRNQPIFKVQTMDEMLTASVGARRFAMLLITMFAGLALILSLVGVYGVIAYSVVQRTREIGIRVALGASKSDILKLMVQQGMIPVAVGLIVGIAGAFAFSRFIAGLLYAVSPFDPTTFIVTPLFMIFVALLASYIPARRAMKVHPVIALRYE